jgi:phosphatidylglycerophosphate synthase
VTRAPAPSPAAPPSRRPLKTRGTRWAAASARALVRLNVRPNHISLFSVVLAAGSAAALWASGRMTGPAAGGWLLAAALLIQGRLLCNMLDGMVAVEGGRKSPSGEIYNELPDRFADALSLVGAGYALGDGAWAVTAGWLAALLAVITAYARALGVAAGAAQQFCGPMAKPQRMAVLTAACVADALLGWAQLGLRLLPWTLALISAGCVVTIARRTIRIVRQLEAR